jgi:hypothetical protein
VLEFNRVTHFFYNFLSLENKRQVLVRHKCHFNVIGLLSIKFTFSNPQSSRKAATSLLLVQCLIKLTAQNFPGNPDFRIRIANRERHLVVDMLHRVHVVVLVTNRCETSGNSDVAMRRCLKIKPGAVAYKDYARSKSN